jgi:hypothetical protein
MTVKIILAGDATSADRGAAAALRRCLASAGAGPAVTIRLGRAAGSGVVLSNEDAYVVQQTAAGGAIDIAISGLGQGVLYGAYAWLERQGWSFHLAGDVAPDAWLPDRGSFTLERSPRFAWRGLQLWNYWWPGRDSWGFADYKAYLDQFPKLGLNQVEIPLYWYEPLFTGVRFQGRDMLRLPLSGCDTAMARVGKHVLSGYGRYTSPDIPDDASPKNRHLAARDLMRRVLAHARSLGIRTVVGIELGNVLLIDPRLLDQLPGADLYEGGRLVQPSSASGRALAQARMDALVKAFPEADIYAVWQSEMGPWRSTQGSPHPEDVAFRNRHAHYRDQLTPGDFDQLQWLRLATEFAGAAKKGARLATGGWGAERLMIAADEVLPPDMVRATIADYEPAFGLRRQAFNAYAHTKGERWHTTWAEVDQHLWIEQTKIGTTRKVLDELEARGVEGVSQLHWRCLFPDPDVHAFRLGCWTGTGDAAEARRAWACAKFGNAAAGDVVRGLKALEDFNTEITDRAVDILSSTWWVGFDCYMGALLNANRYLGPEPLSDTFLADAVVPLLDAAPVLDAHLDRACQSFASALEKDMSAAQRQRLLFWVNRACYSRDLHRAHVRLAEAMEIVARSNDRVGRQRALDIVAAINPEQIVAAFAEQLGEQGVPERGELGLLLTLNVKFIGSIRRIEGALRRLLDPVADLSEGNTLDIRPGARLPVRPYDNFFELLHGQAGPWDPTMDEATVAPGFAYVLTRGGAGRISAAAAMWSDADRVEFTLRAPPGWSGLLRLYFYQEPDWDAAFRHLQILIDGSIVGHVRDFHGRGPFHDEGVWRDHAVRASATGEIHVAVAQLGGGDARISRVILCEDLGPAGRAGTPLSSAA